jgi:hypothetical protein
MSTESDYVKNVRTTSKLHTIIMFVIINMGEILYTKLVVTFMPYLCTQFGMPRYNAWLMPSNQN